MEIHEFDDYRDLISAYINERLGRGGQRKIALELNVQPGYISQVLSKGKIHLSQENLIKIATFLNLDLDEKEYLMDLACLNRAGSHELKIFYQDRINIKIKKLKKISSKVDTSSKELSDRARSIYYSHWAYSTVHMLVGIHEYQTFDSILKKIPIDKKFLNHVVKFLVDNQLIEMSVSKSYSMGKTRIHLDSNSPFIISHHQNFRNLAIASLTKKNDYNLHYSSVLTLSKKDCEVIRSLIMAFLEKKEKVLAPSKDEELIVLNFDLFKID